MTLRAHQRGLTLIELMISILLSMLIAIALLTLLVNINRNNTELARTNSVIENGRFSLQLLESDLSLSGFWGGYMPQFDDISLTTAPSDFPSSVPDPCPTGAFTAWSSAYKAQLVGVPVQVYQVDSTGVPTVCGSAATAPANFITNAKANTDILVVRHAAPCPASSTASDTDCGKVDGQVYFQVSRCPTVDTGSYTFGTLDTSTGDLKNGASTVTLHDGACAANTTMYKYVSTVYWVRNWFVSTTDGIPTLVRTRFTLDSSGNADYTTEALVDGIEGFRVQIGVDNTTKPSTSGGTGTTLTASSFGAAPAFASTSTAYTPTNRGDGSPDIYYTCASGTSCYNSGNLASTAFNLANTVALKLYVLARANTTTPGYSDAKRYCLSSSCTAPASDVTCSPSASPTPDNITQFGPYCDRYKRHAYTQTVRMMNVSMRRELPASW